MPALLQSLSRLNPFSRSVFLRGAILLAASTAIVATAQTVMSLRSALSIVDDAVRSKAVEVTSFVAEEATGAIMFGKLDVLETLFGRAIDTSDGAALGALAVDAAGDTVVDRSDGATDALRVLAERAITTREPTRSEDGFLVAHPVIGGKDASVVGAVAMRWTPEHRRAQIRHEQLITMGWSGALFLLTLVASVLILRATVSRPLLGVGTAMGQVAGGDYDVDVPATARADEIGVIARTLDSFRRSLASAEAATREGLIKGAGFEGSSGAMMMTDAGLKVTHVNAAFRSLLAAAGKPGLDPRGADFDVFGAVPKALRGQFSHPDRLPIHADLQQGDRFLSLDVNVIRDGDGQLIGYVAEWKDITQAHRTAAILGALDASQARVEFGTDGRLSAANATLTALAKASDSEIRGTPMGDCLTAEIDGWSAASALQARRSTAGRFGLTLAGTNLVLDGSLTPIAAEDGTVTGFVLIGSDVTEARAALAEAEAERARLQAAQAGVVEALRRELVRLSEGDLTCAIAEVFTEDYERLRADFNSAVTRLREAMATVLENASAITSESQSISGAADDLSRRTETQAATLEQTVAALGAILENVKGAAEGARRTNAIVTDARTNAENSGRVIRDAVQAMGEIETSSEQISKIIGVIDDISFQTNLLALNAGVEAARAGTAGRGFAVVAAEVRALAQRSSDAAREIGTLISSSGDQVKRGVALVRDAGAALDQIVGSVGEISTHVAGITAAAEEQSTSLDEINVAMQQLDEVTQKNAAAFEETTAASHALTGEAQTLTRTMMRFRIEAGAASSVPTASSGHEAFRRALG